MQIALATTTINYPKVLDLYHERSVNVRHFVAGDTKTPPIQSSMWLHYLSPEDQKPWKCSELLGWNTMARRNIAFLEALKWGAELVVSVDDDNIPLDNNDYSWAHELCVLRPFNGLCAGSKSGWFDPGQLLVPWAKHRGIPHAYHAHEYFPVVGAKVGVSAGLVLGDSDVDATTRLERPLGVNTLQVSALAHSGVVPACGTHTVFNTQNTAVIRDLVPAWFLMPGVGRMDDIYASLIMQRVMAERGLHVHFGQPFVYQQRNKHDLLKDLEDEIEGYKHVKLMANMLDQIVLTGASVIDDTRRIYTALQNAAWIPSTAIAAAYIFLDDCESVL